MEESYNDLVPQRKLSLVVVENVLAWLENLRTLPSVASASKGEHGWVYKIETGEVFRCNPTGQFSRLTGDNESPWSTRRLGSSGLSERLARNHQCPQLNKRTRLPHTEPPLAAKQNRAGGCSPLKGASEK